MPTPTYTPLATVTLGSSASTVTFSNIPATYRDLIVVGQATGTSNGHLNIRYNNDSASNYFRVGMQGNGSSAQAYTGNETGVFAFQSRSTTGSFVHQILDYSATNKHKTGLTREDSTIAVVAAIASRWANTAAITSLTFLVDAGQIGSNSTFSLYGVIA